MQDEKKDLILLLLITAGISLFGFFLFSFAQSAFIPDLKVSSYEASFSWDGSLHESYIYDVSASHQFRSLNRNFENQVYDDVHFGTYIRFISMKTPDGTIGYMKNADGDVILTKEDGSIRKIITDRAGKNEAGAFKPGYFGSGSYQISYSWDIVPPVERGTDDDHLNIDLATSHVPYESVRIEFPSSGVHEVFPHPADLAVTRTDESYILTGSVAKDIPLGFELVIDPSVTSLLDGEVRTITDSVKKKTRQANPWYLSVINPLYRLISFLSVLFLFIIPVLLLVIWYRYGREKQYDVPEHLSFVPDTKLKPWLVSLVFSGDPEKFKEEGLHATLIDLHRRGNLSIKHSTGKGFSIRILNKTTGDRYEKQVIRTLSLLSDDEIVTNDTFTRIASDANKNPSIRSQLMEFQKSFNDLPSGVKDHVVSSYIRSGHASLIPLLAISIGIFFISFVLMFVGPGDRMLLGQAVYNSSLCILQVIIAYVFPISLFGTWKGDFYRERLQWESFRRFLSDSVMMQRYSPDDISIWGDWMVYGTALGVGDRVSETLKSLKIQVPDLPSEGWFAPALFHTGFSPMLYYSPPSSGSGGSFGGGEFGGGGGFGGGGAGGW